MQGIVGVRPGYSGAGAARARARGGRLLCSWLKEIARAATVDGGRGFRMTLVNSTDAPMPVRIEACGAGDAAGAAVFVAADPTAENSLAVPDRVKPARALVLMHAGVIERTLPAYSVSVVRPRDEDAATRVNNCLRSLHHASHLAQGPPFAMSVHVDGHASVRGEIARC